VTARSAIESNLFFMIWCKWVRLKLAVKYKINFNR
jgi:hypothetical protein